MTKIDGLKAYKRSMTDRKAKANYDKNYDRIFKKKKDKGEGRK